MRKSYRTRKGVERTRKMKMRKMGSVRCKMGSSLASCRSLLFHNPTHPGVMLTGLGASEKSGLATGLNLGDLDSTQSQAGRGFTQNPTEHFCCLFNCTHDCIILRKSS